MPDTRIKDFSATADLPASDDFVPIDGATGGTRKWPARRILDLVNTRATQGALAFDGTSTAMANATMTGQLIGTDAASVAVKLRLPSSNPASPQGFFCVASDSTGFGGRDFYGEISSSGVLSINLRNAANNAVFSANVTANAVTTWGGKVVIIVVTRSGSTLTIYVNGVSQVFTTSGSNDTNDFSQTITSTYFRAGNSGASRGFSGSIYSASLYNLALSQADVTEIQELGGGVPERYKFGSQVNYLSGNDANFSGSGNWSANGTTTATVTGGQLVVTGLTNSGSNFLSSPSWAQSSVGSKTAKRRYRATVDVVAISLAGAATKINVFSPIYSNSTPVGDFNSTGSKTFDFDYVSGGSDASSMLSFYRNESSGGCDVTLDNVTLKTVGAVAHYDADLGGVGLQLPDQGANKLHALLTTTGVTWTKPATMGYVRALSDGTTAAQQLGGGGTILPANCQIVRIRARSTSGTPSITLGTSSGGSQIVASVALSTTWKDLTIALTGGINSSAASLWMTASAANVVEVQLAYEQLPA